ncbi:MAG: hypothetical protein E7211_18565 [Clostridium lundense]|nr:hypothetical protein [Clostridium lundense]
MGRRRSKQIKRSHTYRSTAHRCPVCRRYEFSARCSFDICPVCGWIDDSYQEEFPDEDCCANSMSLNEAKRAYEALCEKHPQNYSILEATHYNWSLIKAGDWEKTEWFVNSDGAFLRRSYYIMTLEEIERLKTAGVYDKACKECGLRRIYTENGKMTMPKYSALLDAMDVNPWRPDGERICACDGDAWKFQRFDITGKTVQDSGPVDYIYGNEVLERIAKLLP